MDSKEAHRTRDAVVITTVKGLVDIADAAGLVPLVGVVALLDSSGGLAVQVISDKGLHASEGEGQALTIEIREAIARFVKSLPGMEVVMPGGAS